MSLLHTPICDFLNIKYPIIQAGMGGITTPNLVAAVSNTGGLGMLAAFSMTSEQLKQHITLIKNKTNKPFGVNLLLALPEVGNTNVASVQPILGQFRNDLDIPSKIHADIKLPQSHVEEKIQTILEEKVQVISFAMGDPSKYVHQIHDKGVKVMSMVTNVEEAIHTVRAGVDIVIAQGAEAGGHRSHIESGSVNDHAHLIGTMALVPQIVDSIKKEKKNAYVIAAGGIADGRGLLASIVLGADGVSIGTRFLVSSESGAFTNYKERLLNSTEADTVVTRVFTGRSARGIRNRLVDEYVNSRQVPLVWPFQALAVEDIYKAAQTKNNADYFPLLAGQGLRLIKRGQSAKEIIEEIVQEAEQELSSLASRAQ